MMSETLLDVSMGAIKLGEWNGNFTSGRAVADVYHIPMVVVYGGLSCGYCEQLQKACKTQTFLDWQAKNKMVLIYTTNNMRGNAIDFVKTDNGGGYPYVAVYWNRDGNVPARGSQNYKTFVGRHNQMPVTGGSLVNQFIRSLEMVTAEYVYDPTLDIAGDPTLLYNVPVTRQLEYNLKLFTTLDAAGALAPQQIYNVRPLGKGPKLQRVSGELPSGVKLSIVDNAVVLSGSARKAGNYTYEFYITQNTGTMVYDGPSIRLHMTVAAASDVAAGGNARLGKSVKATLPLFAEEGGVKVVKGVLEFSSSAQSAIKAKYYGLTRQATTFSGKWATLEGGTVAAALTAKNGSVLTLSMTAAGALTATVRERAGGATLSSGALTVGTGNFASAFESMATASFAETNAASGAGAGYILVKKIGSNGKASWSALLPSGQSVSGSATVTTDAAGRAVLPVFKFRNKDYLAASLTLAPGGGAVSSTDGAIARWATTVAPAAVHDCAVRAATYPKNATLPAGAYALRAVAEGFASERYGALSAVPAADVTVTAEGMSLAAKSQDIKLSFMRNTGVFKGSAKLAFASGSVAAKLAGVVVLDGAQPLAVGAAYFPDTAGGKATKRGFTVKIETK